MARAKSQKLNIGEKVFRVRELRGITQGGLAKRMGVSQQTISKLEKADEIEDEKLEEIAEALKVSPEVIKNFNDDAVFNNIQNNHDTATKNSYTVNYQLNSVEKVEELYKKLLESKQAEIDLLRELLARVNNK